MAHPTADGTASPNPVAMFLHIQKTAGTTFNSILSYQYGHKRSLWIPWDHVNPDCLLNLTPSQLDRLTLIRGHFPFGWHQLIDRPVRYITMLRHPVDRVISLYYYFKNGPNCPEQRLAKSCRTLEEFVTCERTEMVANDQVRRLAGSDAGFGDIDAKTLTQAITNLHTFDCVGLTERFDESILLMAKALNWKKPLFYLPSNVTRRRPTLAAVSARTRSVIESYNEHDLALYAEAEQLFERQVATCECMSTATARLRRRNRLAGRVLPVPLWLLRGIRSVISPEFQLHPPQ